MDEIITKVSETEFKITDPVTVVETLESVEEKIFAEKDNKRQLEADIVTLQGNIIRIDEKIAKYEAYIASAKAKGVKEEVKDDIIKSEELN